MRDKYQSLTINCGFQRRSCQKMLWHWGLQPPWMYNKRRLLWVQIQMNSSPSQVALPWELKRRRWWHEELESHSIMWVIDTQWTEKKLWKLYKWLQGIHLPRMYNRWRLSSGLYTHEYQLLADCTFYLENWSTDVNDTQLPRMHNRWRLSPSSDPNE